MIFTFSSESRMHELIAKANKHIAKLNLDPITVVSVTSRKVSKVDENDNRSVRVVWDADLNIPTELVQIEGQQVVARLININDSNIITRIAATDDDLTPYREAKIVCDHCKTKRNRKGSWVIKSEQRGLIQVGDSCVDLYFGANVSGMLQASDTVMRVMNEEEEEEGYGHHFDMDRFVSAAAFYTMTSGFKSQKQAESNMTTSTRDMANYLTTPPSVGRNLEWESENSRYTEWIDNNFKNMSIYEAVLDWWMSKTEFSEFEHNCRVAIMSHNPKFLGLVTFGVKLWVDANYGSNGSTEKDKKEESDWVGEVSKRQVFSDLKVIGIKFFEDSFGGKHLISLEDTNGNQIIWWASSNPQFTIGETCALKGTVKAHNDYKGRKQTVITRCAIV